MAKYKLSLNDFCKKHAAIGDMLGAAKESMTEGGSYKLKLNRVRAAHARMGEMLDAAYSTMTDDEGNPSPMRPRGSEAQPRGATDSADAIGLDAARKRSAFMNETFPGFNRLGGNLAGHTPRRD